MSTKQILSPPNKSIQLLQELWQPVSFYFYLKDYNKPIKYSFSYLFENDNFFGANKQNTDKIQNIILKHQQQNQKIQRIVAIANLPTLKQLNLHIKAINRKLPPNKIINFHTMPIAKKIEDLKHQQNLENILTNIEDIERKYKTHQNPNFKEN